MHVRIGAHHRRHGLGGLAQLAQVFAGNTELHRIADRRSVFEAQHARTNVGQPALPVGYPGRALGGKIGFEALLQVFARVDVGGDDDELREVVVEKLLVERQIEARRAVAEITGEVLDRRLHLRIAQQLPFDLGRLRLGRFERSALRQPQVDQQFGSLGIGEELLLHALGKRDQRQHKNRQRDGDHQPTPAHAEVDGAMHAPIKRCLIDVVAVLLRLGLQLFGVEDLVAEIRREHHRDDPRDDERDADDVENRRRVFAGARLGETDRGKPGDGNQRPGEHRESRRRIGEGRRAEAVPTLLHFDDHHLDGDDRVVDQQPERDDQRTERDALQVDSDEFHRQEGDRQHERNRQRDDGAGA